MKTMSSLLRLFFLAFPFTFYQSMACGRLLPHERAAAAVESSLGRRQWVCCLCRGFLLGNSFVYAVEEEKCVSWANVKSHNN